MHTIELRNISKVIKNNIVLSNINYKFESGKVYGLKGRKRFRQKHASQNDQRFDPSDVGFGDYLTEKNFTRRLSLRAI